MFLIVLLARDMKWWNGANFSAFKVMNRLWKWSGIQASHKREWICAMCDKRDESGDHYSNLVKDRKTVAELLLSCSEWNTGIIEGDSRTMVSRGCGDQSRTHLSEGSLVGTIQQWETRIVWYGLA